MKSYVYVVDLTGLSFEFETKMPGREESIFANRGFRFSTHTFSSPLAYHIAKSMARDK